MTLLNWIGEHPWLTVILLVVVGSVIEDLISAFRK